MKANGDRLYLNESLKLKVDLVEVLKKMNSTYPKNSTDFDAEFLHRAMKPMFSRDELKKCFDANNLRRLDVTTFRFLKGKTFCNTV